MNLAQATMDSRLYVFAPSPSPANLQTAPSHSDLISFNSMVEDPANFLIAPATSATSGVIRRGFECILPDNPQNRKKLVSHDLDNMWDVRFLQVGCLKAPIRRGSLGLWRNARNRADRFSLRRLASSNALRTDFDPLMLES